MRCMALACVVYGEICTSEGGEERDEAWDERLEACDGVALRVEIATYAKEVALHVDYYECCCVWGEGGVMGPGIGERGRDLARHDAEL